jgi:choline-sulfatase
LRSAVRVLLFASLLSSAGCGRGDRFLFRNAPVVLISVDTLRADHLPAYGYRAVATPNVDALRRDSVLFENAYSQVPLTLPSHACLFTGLLPAQSGVRDNFGYKLSAGSETLATFLQEHGYATGAAVSSAILSRETGMDQGFEFYDDQIEAGGRAERDGARSAEALLRWLEQKRRGPVFAFLHVYEPHAPYDPPEPYRSRYPLAYDGEIARADEIVGIFLDRLHKWGLYDPALILFLSDHGEGLGDHGEREHGVFLYREEIRVPLLVKFPGHVRPRETVSAPVGLIDIFPTVARVLGLVPPLGRTGVPLTAFLGTGTGPERRLFSETLYPRLRLGWSDLASLVGERYHYIEAPRPELYDIVVDPGEKRDLSKGLPPPFRAMRAELARMARPLEMPGLSDPEQTRKLVSLGYLSATSPVAKTKDLPDPKDRIGELDGSLEFGRLLAQGRDAELIRACRSFLEKNPATIDVWSLLAGALERAGRRTEAIAALKEGLRASAATTLPALRIPALEHLTYLLIQSGKIEEALSLADTDSFSDPKALTAVGVAQGKAGRLEQARNTFQKVLSLDPDNALAHFNLGTALMDSGDLQAARDHFEHAVRSDPKYASAWSSLGQARASLGDEAAAMECWRRAVELDGTQYGALYNLAIAQGRRGQLDAARQTLQRFVANAPPALFAKDLVEARRLLKSLGRT